jgi:hypothetical protein
MLKWFIPVVFASQIVAADSMLDLRVAVDPYDAKNRSHIDVVSQTFYETSHGWLLINPEIAFYLNRSVDFGCSFGYRWKTKYGAMGHHVFFDRAQMPKISINQIGASLDWITPAFDLRTSYYHPITPPILYKNAFIRPCKWAEVELLIKNRYCNIGVSPNVNIESLVYGVSGKVVFPFEYFSLGVGAAVDQTGSKQGFLITSFHLYKNKGSSVGGQPAVHNRRPRLHFAPIKPKKPPKQDPVQEEPKDPIEEDMITPEEIRTQLEKCRPTECDDYEWIKLVNEYCERQKLKTDPIALEDLPFDIRNHPYYEEIHRRYQERKAELVEKARIAAEEAKVKEPELAPQEEGGIFNWILSWF